MANKLNSSYYEEKSEKWYITEMHNYRYIIDHLQEEIENLIEQILPNHRQRRGIINGLGSIIKVITGNMDQEDAERINQQIQDLQQGQKNNAKVLKKQISLAKNAIVSFNNTISNLKHNQVILESRILQISKIITESQKYSNRYDIVLQSIVYSQLTNNFSIILRILSEIRTALVFSRINVMHPSIIEPHLLIRDFTSITDSITDSQSTLPINPTTANIMILESLIDIKAYQQHSTITFLLEVPLVSKETYDLYHLYSLPIPINNMICIIYIHYQYQSITP
ncbi:Baculovirus F protein [Popillia japonica]|uniref:Baculovirus F protein n=1 Tax=Popillia japonica TaxID=7064 RepID=A0AAW1L8T4_POPJA